MFENYVSIELIILLLENLKKEKNYYLSKVHNSIVPPTLAFLLYLNTFCKLKYWLEMGL